MNKTRILIADDHAIVRMGLELLLSSEPDFAVVGEAQDGAEAVAACERLKPDAVVLDLMMPKKDGIAATGEIHRACPETKIVILTSFGTAEGLAQTLRNGAGAIVLKSSAETELVTAIRAVLAGRTHLTPGLRRQIRESDSHAVALTDRQTAIIRAVIDGFSNADIARQQGLAEITVKNHLTAIFNKLGAANRAEAAAIALRKHLLKI